MGHLTALLLALALKTANANKVDLSHSTGVLSGMGIAMEAASASKRAAPLSRRARAAPCASLTLSARRWIATTW